MFIILTELIIFLLFFLLISRLIVRRNITGIFIILIAIAAVTIGEAMNLTVFKMAVYNGCYGIPAYIILGGTLVSWGIYRSAFALDRKYNKNCIFFRIFIIMLFSLGLPIIEIFGLKTGLWYWRRPYSILSIGWYLGVWKFYFLFLVTPALVGQVFKTSNNSCGNREI